MFNVNNTYIRISGCIINVPLSQSGEVKYYSITVRISQSITGNVSIYPFVNTNLPNYSDYTRRYSVSGGSCGN